MSVCFRDPAGTRWQANVTGHTAFEAAAAALKFFDAAYWKGPRPAPNDVLELAPMGSAGIRIRVSRVLEAIVVGRAISKLFGPGPIDVEELADLVGAAVTAGPVVFV